MSFSDLPIIPTTTLFRAAMVTPRCGNNVLRKLSENGRISPQETLTRRAFLSPRDGEVLFNELVQKAQ